MKQANDFMPRVTELIEASITTKQELFRSRETLSTIAKVSELLVSALRQGDKVLLFGNGGSAADNPQTDPFCNSTIASAAASRSRRVDRRTKFSVNF